MSDCRRVSECFGSLAATKITLSADVSQSHAPKATKTADVPKMTGHSLNGRKATLKPVNRETIARTTRVPVATA